MNDPDNLNLINDTTLFVHSKQLITGLNHITNTALSPPSEHRLDQLTVLLIGQFNKKEKLAHSMVSLEANFGGFLDTSPSEN